MNKNLYREKVLNAILYYSKQVKHPSKVKIFKLLYFLDFMHFNQIGRSVTNYKYFAWDFGPVPKDLWIELEKGIPEDFKDYMSLNTIPLPDGKTEVDFKPLKKENISLFTPREKQIMDDLIFIYKNATPSQMTEITHLKNSPWSKTKKEKGMNSEIDYALSIDDRSFLTEEEAKLYLKDKDEFLSNYPM
jgi:uncharacterized phage-associated protein